MVSVLNHVLWGIIVYKVFSFEGLLLFLFFTILPDFDYLIYRILKNYFHRVYFHNIFVISVLSAVVYFLFGNVDYVVALFLHILLDLFDGEGVPMLFPFTEKRFLIYPVGAALPLPAKIFWEGNIYFSLLTFILVFLTILY